MREIEVDYMNINEVFSGLDKLFAENRLPEVERYLTQALSDAEYEKDTDSMLAIYNELIGFHRTTGEHDKALYFCRQVMRLAHKMGIEDTVPYGTALMNIANENRAAGNLLEALSYCRKVYDIYSEQLGPYDILLAGYYNNVALIYQELGDYDKAVDALEHALSIIERHENAGTEIVATYANLGESLLRAGRRRCADISSRVSEDITTVLRCLLLQRCGTDRRITSRHSNFISLRQKNSTVSMGTMIHTEL